MRREPLLCPLIAMPYKERPVEKLYFTIGEVADTVGVNTSVIRYWEKEFGNLRPRRDSRGDRSYTQDDIRKVKLIQYLLKERGFTIQGAREHLRAEPRSAERITEAIERLKRVRAILLEARARIGQRPV